MADNVTLNAGTTVGAVIATDEAVGGEHYQYMKVAFGADGTQTLVASGVAGLPVTLEAGANNIGTVSLSGSATVIIASGTVTAVTDITNPVTVTGAVAISLSSSMVISAPVSLSSSYTVAAIKGALPAGTNHLGSISLTGSSSVFISNAVTVTGAVAVSLSHSVVISSMPAITGAVSLTGSSSVLVGGTVAHDAAATGTNPVLNGWEARTTMPTAVGNGDVVRAMADDNGRVVNTPVAPRDLVGMLAHSATVSTTTTWLPAGGAGVFRDIVGFVMMNPSSATQATVTIYSSVTTGTVVMKFELAPNGGLTYTPSTPIPGAAANNAWGIQSNVVGVLSSIQYVDNN